MTIYDSEYLFPLNGRHYWRTNTGWFVSTPTIDPPPDGATECYDLRSLVAYDKHLATVNRIWAEAFPESSNTGQDRFVFCGPADEVRARLARAPNRYRVLSDLDDPHSDVLYLFDSGAGP